MVITAHLQPPFFSIVDWHFVHSLVLACSQFEVSESSAHFFSHCRTTLQRTGRWLAAYPQLAVSDASHVQLEKSTHPKHSSLPQLQRTVGTSWDSILGGACEHSITFSHSGCGHHRRFAESATYASLSSLRYLRSALVLPIASSPLKSLSKKPMGSPFANRLWEHILDDFLPDNSPASILHALDPCAFRLSLDLRRQVLLPTRLAEPMPASERERLVGNHGRIVVHATNRTFERGGGQ